MEFRPAFALLAILLSLSSTNVARASADVDGLFCPGLFANEAEFNSRLLVAYAKLLSEYRAQLTPAEFEAFLRERLRTETFYSWPRESQSYGNLAGRIGDARKGEAFDLEIRRELEKNLAVEAKAIERVEKAVKETIEAADSSFAIDHIGFGGTLALNSTGTRAVIQPVEGVLAVYDIVAKKELFRFPHPGTRSIGVRDDFKLLASVSWDGSFVLFDLDTGARRLEIPGVGEGGPFAIDPTFSRALLKDSEGLRLLDLKSGAVLKKIPGSFESNSIRVNADFTRAVLKAVPYEYSLIDLESGKVLRSFSTHEVFLDREFRTGLAIDGRDTLLFDTRSGRTLRRMPGMLLHADADFRRAILLQKDQFDATVWDLAGRRLVRKVHSPAAFGSARVSPDGKTGVLNSLSGEILSVDLDHDTPVEWFKTSADVRDTVFTADSKNMITIGSHRHIIYWDLQSRTPLHGWISKEDFHYSVIRPEQQMGVSIVSGNRIRFWDLRQTRMDY